MRIFKCPTKKDIFFFRSLNAVPHVLQSQFVPFKFPLQVDPCKLFSGRSLNIAGIKGEKLR